MKNIIKHDTFLSLKGTTHAYLLKLSITHNQNPLLYLLINCTRRLFNETFINHCSKTSLISIVYWILAILNVYQIMPYQKLLSQLILKISISQMVLKAILISLALINISWVSCFFKFLYYFFVFSKCSKSTARKSWLPQMHFRHEFMSC